MAAYREPMNMRSGGGAPVSAEQGHSAWHSPVPYLFGGLAAMLGLIAFALLILACSYWKLSGYLEGNGESNPDVEAAQGKTTQQPQRLYEDKILVIMAGQDNPTFLATPTTTSPFANNTTTTSSSTCTCHHNP